MEAGQGLNNLFTSAQQSGMPILIYRNVVHVNWGIFPVIKLLRPDLTLSPIPMTFIIARSHVSASQSFDYDSEKEMSH